jgi:hypothetical protein
VMAAGNSSTHRCFAVLTKLYIPKGSRMNYVGRPRKLPPNIRKGEIVHGLFLTLT